MKPGLCDLCGQYVPTTGLRGGKVADPESTLDGAWLAVEKALPEGWWFVGLQQHGYTEKLTGGKSVHVRWWTAEAQGPVDNDESGHGTTPTEALRTLAGLLRVGKPPVSDDTEGAG